jgi:hypothetical protein
MNEASAAVEAAVAVVPRNVRRRKSPDGGLGMNGCDIGAVTPS